MADNKKFSQEMKNYYDSLPSFVQESISQSSSSFNDLNELRSFADELQNNRNSFKNKNNRNSNSQRNQ